MPNLSGKILFFILILLSSSTSFSQNLTGVVKGENENKKEPLEDAVVKWINTGKGTATDEKGKFEISAEGITDRRIIVSITGYKRDTLTVSDISFIEIVLIQDASTETIEVEDEQSSTFISDDVAKTEVITSQELVKDACCDLSGCFGKNSSVEVAVTDIITDSKELKILGLEGVYTQILIDNMPMMNGLNVKYGVSSIPGTMIDRITISKGSNSVIQGYESISGIMNVLLKNYDNTDGFLFNGFVNSMLEKQVNMNMTNELNKNINTILTLHSAQKSNRVDENNDGFLDNPLITRYTLFNKWNFVNEKSRSEINVAGRYWNEERSGGQNSYDINTGEGSNLIYGQTAKINSLDGYFRYAKAIDETRGIKLYLNANYYDQNSFYGITKYDAVQNNFVAMGFYEFEVFGEFLLKTGLSYKYLDINENISYSDTTYKTYSGNYLKKESIPGIFAEKSINILDEKATLMTGVRLDYHNDYGMIFTPRILLRYQPENEIVFRVSAGTGFRTVNLFSDNSNLLASSRNIIIAEELNPEKIFNYGADVLYYFAFGNFAGSLNLDFYRTEFSNKIIPDYDTDPSEVIFANLNGTAFSNVFQSEANINLTRGFDVKLAYKMIDLQYERDGVFYQQPFNSAHRFFSSFSYTNEYWSISSGLQWFGVQQIPSTASNPFRYQRPEQSESYAMVNLQFNKFFDYFELYAGIENILDFKQDFPIISADDPFGPYFDTSFIWGPTKGREFYFGFRLSLD
ncbi:MAG: TonB-dependent receptor [Ignavibacteria bacterium]|nr:TonB-dependent receptor [Ignavibacteria bacterium]